MACEVKAPMRPQPMTAAVILSPVMQPIAKGK
jgi:hypothetical protein